MPLPMQRTTKNPSIATSATIGPGWNFAQNPKWFGTLQELDGAIMAQAVIPFDPTSDDGNGGFVPNVSNRPILTATPIFNTSKTATTDFFAAEITPKYQTSLMRSWVSLHVSGIFYVTVTNSLGTEKLIPFNSGTALGVDQGFVFDWGCDSSVTINYQQQNTGVVNYCAVQEIPTAGS